VSVSYALIGIQLINDPPGFTPDSAPDGFFPDVTFVEGAAGVFMFENVTITDPDSSMIYRIHAVLTVSGRSCTVCARTHDGVGADEGLEYADPSSVGGSSDSVELVSDGATIHVH